MDPFSVLTTAAVGIIPPTMISAGRALLEKDPFGRAIKRMESEFFAVAADLRPSFENWLTDADALRVIREIKRGGASPELTEELLDSFVSASTIQDLDREAARRFVRHFWEFLRQEALKEDTGPWQLENAFRAEAERTRKKLGLQIERLGADVAKIQQAVLGDAVRSEREEDSAWHKRIDHTNRMFGGGRIRSALTSYEQILQDAEKEDVGPRVRYRLHANIGSCLVALGDWNEAEGQFRKALRAEPDEALPLSHLAQIDLHSGDLEGAIRYSDRALEQDPDNLIAWVIRLQAGTDPDWEQAPQVVKEKPEFWIARSRRASQQGSYSAATAAAREALRLSERATDLIQVAEMLYSVGVARPGVPISRELEDEVVHLTDEALDGLAEGEWPSLAAQARTLRGIARMTTSQPSAEQDLQRAIELEPHSLTPRLALAHLLYREGKHEEALYILHKSRSDEDDPRVPALKARVFAAVGRPVQDVERELLQAVALIGEGVERDGLLLDLADTATRTGLIGVAERVLDEVDESKAPLETNVFRSRVASAKGNSADAIDTYKRAMDEIGATPHADVAQEFAGYLMSLDRYGEAAQVLEKSGAIEGPESGQRQFAYALMQAGEWAKLQDLLDEVLDSAEPPTWGLDAASVLALRKDDLANARVYLETMVAREVEGATAVIRLAYALLRMGDAEGATRQLGGLAIDELESDELIQVGGLYSHAGETTLAIQAAYAAWRDTPADIQAGGLLASLVFQAGSDLQLLQDPDEVGEGSWVRLESVGDEREVSFLIPRDGPLPGRPDELDAASDVADRLRGMSVNEEVVLRPQDLDPVTYRIREIRTEFVRGAQVASRLMATHVGDGVSPLQPIRIGEPDSVRFATSLIAVLHRKGRSGEEVRETYQKIGAPLALVANATGRTLREVYWLMTEGENGPLHVERGTPSSLRISAVKAESSEDIGVDLSALLTLQRTGLTGLLPRMYESIRLPQGLVTSLRTERELIQRRLEQGQFTHMGLGPAGLDLRDLPPELLREEIEKIQALESFIDEHATLVARPIEAVEAMEHGDQGLRDALGDVAMDTIYAASPDVPLYADDRGLREITAEKRGASTFSTISLLIAAERRGELSPADSLAATVALVRAHHTFVPISSRLLMSALRADGLVLGPNLQAVTARLSPTVSSPRSVLLIAATFLKEVAQSVLAGAALRGVIWTVLQTLWVGPDPRELLKRFDQVVQGALAYLPLAHDEYLEVRNAFLQTKAVDPRRVD